LRTEKHSTCYELVWEDTDRYPKDRTAEAIASQIVRSAGSISANIEEGQGRGFKGKERKQYLRIALGSARETKGWYFRSRRLMDREVVISRMELVSEVIALLATEMR
jgi:four helix bundle protein